METRRASLLSGWFFFGVGALLVASLLGILGLPLTLASKVSTGMGAVGVIVGMITQSYRR